MKTLIPMPSDIKHLQLFMLFLLFYKPSFGQSNTEILFQLSEQFYKNYDKVCVLVETRFKNAIMIDTLYRDEKCYVDRAAGIELFIGKNSVLKYHNSQYIIYRGKDSFEQVKDKDRKYSAYEQEYKHFPFTQTASFFIRWRKFFGKNSRIEESDSLFTVSNSGKSIVFRKTNYSIKSITEIIYDRLNKGYQFKQISFNNIENITEEGETEMRKALNLISDSSKIMVSTKTEKPSVIEPMLLQNKLTQIINGQVGTIKDKFVLLDFFYQGCFPCVKSYPFINKLFLGKDSSLVVVGVDQLLRDTATIDKYIEKYSLKYPILVGEQAVFLTNYFKLHSFPTFVLINPNGNIVEYGYGFTQNSFKKLLRKLTSFASQESPN